MPLSLRTSLAVVFALAAAALTFGAVSSGAAPSSLPAFAGAEGFGALATGGRGGAVWHVTTLDDSGPGSFREAVSQPNRIVVFDVGGVIRLKSNVEVANNITIAGQTAPGEGICLYGQSLSLGKRSNIIIRYLRIRQGMSGDRGKKALGMDAAANIMIDHCSIQWGRWDDLGITVGSRDITVQDCLIAEAIHPQSFGALVDNVTGVTLSRNLWMSNESRNPKAKGTIQYINNVVYNWGIYGLCGGHSAADRWLDVINNLFIKGPSSNDRWAGQFYPSDHVYQSGNFIDMDRDGTLNPRLAQPGDFHQPADAAPKEVVATGKPPYTLPTFVEAPSMRPAIPVKLLSATEAYAKIAAEVGCSLRRDAIDRRLIEELRSLGKKGATIPHTDDRGEALVGGIQEVVGGPAPTDTDRDGMPDAWETSRGLDPKDPTDGARIAKSGYSHVEEYLNGIVSR